MAMTLGLREPKLPGVLIAVDNAPVVAPLEQNFLKYVQGMRKVEQLKIIKRHEADQIMQSYEKVYHYNRLLGKLFDELTSTFILVAANPPISSSQSVSTPRLKTSSVSNPDRYSGVQPFIARRFSLQGYRRGVLCRSFSVRERNEKSLCA